MDSVEPPSALIATDVSCDNGGSIALNWTLSPDDPAKVTGYNIYRKDSSGGSYASIGSVGAGISSYLDNSAATGIAYDYTIRATDGVNESIDSNEAAATSMRNLPLAPANLLASDTQYDLGGSITLAWTKSPDDGAGLNNVYAYDIYRYSATSGSSMLLAAVAAGTVSYVDSPTIDTDTYSYTIKAFDSVCGESGPSNIATGRSINNLAALPGFIGTLPGISPQILNSLLAKVENAIAAYDRGNETAAINILNALLNEISAQSGKKITADAADTLTTYIENLITYMQSN